MKINRQLLAINIFLGIGMVVLIAYYLFMDENYSAKKAISDEKRLALELRIPLYPDNAAVKQYYSNFIEDGVVTKAEYVTLVELEQKFKDHLGSDSTNASDTEQAAKTPLEKERANLEAFDRIGALALPPEMVGPAREAITDKIAKLENEEANTKKPN